MDIVTVNVKRWFDDGSDMELSYVKGAWDDFIKNDTKPLTDEKLEIIDLSDIKYGHQV